MLAEIILSFLVGVVVGVAGLIIVVFAYDRKHH